MLALGYTRYITSALQAMRGFGLSMPLLYKANAPDNAIRQSTYRIPVPRSGSIVPFAMRASHEHLPPLRTCRRSYDPCSSGFPISHVVPRVGGSVLVAETEAMTGAIACPKKSFAKKTSQ